MPEITPDTTGQTHELDELPLDLLDDERLDELLLEELLLEEELRLDDELLLDDELRLEELRDDDELRLLEELELETEEELQLLDDELDELLENGTTDELLLLDELLEEAIPHAPHLDPANQPPHIAPRQANAPCGVLQYTTDICGIFNKSIHVHTLHAAIDVASIHRHTEQDASYRYAP